jgi:hypothetical protein
MAVNPSQIPLHHPIADNQNFVNQQWAFWFQQFSQSLAPQGTGYVVDGTAQTYGQMTIYQGPAINRGNSPNLGDIYFGVDTGQIWVEQGGVWVQQFPQLSGDVVNALGNTDIQLKVVNSTVGTFGNSINVPQLTVDEKGRITNVVDVPIAAPAASAQGPIGSIQYNNAGLLDGSPALTWNNATNSLQTANQFVTGEISFTNPQPTFTNLSPLTTKGDLLGHNGSINIRVPVGANGQVLVANTATASGLSWSNVSISGDGTTPYYIPTGDTFVNQEYRQNLFTIPITVDGDIVVNGYLIEV